VGEIGHFVDNVRRGPFEKFDEKVGDLEPLGCGFHPFEGLDES